MSKFTFIDLFAGIGGFHQAMKSLGGKCVFVCENDEQCVETYKKNYDVKEIYGNIRNINPKKDVPNFDCLCAGFPCQSFSKAGLRKGFKDEQRGDLFDYIIKILKDHQEAKFIILENVRNLADDEDNWKHIQEELMKLNFFITEEPIILSPSDFGIPQVRERVYILGIRKDLRDIEKLKNGYIHISDLHLEKQMKKCGSKAALSILDNKKGNISTLTDEQVEMLGAWEEFRNQCLAESIGSPVWLHYFGTDFEDDKSFYRSCGFYKNKKNRTPEWKQRFITRNRELYKKNKEWIDEWIVRYDMKNRSRIYQKFEWNCRGKCETMHDGIIQFRQSGIRVKAPNSFPSLVAMVNTPIIWDTEIEEFRYITVEEAAKLQSFKSDFDFGESKHTAYKQLGNSVNVKVLKILGKALTNLLVEDWEEK